MSAVEDVSGVAVGAVGDVSVPRPGRRGGWSSPAPVPALQQRLLQRPAAHEGTAQHQLRHGEFKCLFINIKFRLYLWNACSFLSSRSLVLLIALLLLAV